MNEEQAAFNFAPSDTASEMTYIVSSGALNSTHSLTVWAILEVVFTANCWTLFIVREKHLSTSANPDNKLNT